MGEAPPTRSHLVTYISAPSSAIRHTGYKSVGAGPKYACLSRSSELHYLGKQEISRCREGVSDVE